MRALMIAALLLSGVAATPLAAQSGEIVTLRVDKLEKEMKAVQRKVFPTGAPVEPELGGARPAGLAAGDASATPISDLTARVDALEIQLRQMTGQVELQGNRLRRTEELTKALEARVKLLEPVPDVIAADPAPTKPAALAAVTPAKPAATKPTTLVKPAAATAKPPAAKPDGARKALIDAVEIPASGDAIEDAYSYGFRLWTAKLYPEAQVKLKEFVAKYPSHRRASYAQNLLGRAYLEEGKPALASVAFYDSYQKMPRGDRASESLYWLGIALTRLKKLPDACKVYDEFDEVYGGKAAADLKAKVAKGRTDAKCAG